MGRETNLWIDLDRSVDHEPSTMSDWENPDAKHEWGPGKDPGSKNIYKLSRSLRLTNYSRLKNKAKLKATEEECIQILSAEKANGFMDIEQDSPIYWGFHLTLPITIISMSENKKLVDLAYEWWYNLKLTMDLCDIYPEKVDQSQILLCGMRGVDDEGWTVDQLEWFHCGAYNGGPYYKEWYRPFAKHMGLVWRTYEHKLIEHAHIWPKRVPLHILNFEKGKVVFVEKNLSHSTPCRQAAIYDATDRERKRVLWYGDTPGSVGGYLPANHSRHRSVFDKSHAYLVGGYEALVYESEYFTKGEQQVHGLASLGKLLQHRKWDMSGLTDNVDKQIETRPDVPTVPTRPVKTKKKGCRLFG